MFLSTILVRFYHVIWSLPKMMDCTTDGCHRPFAMVLSGEGAEVANLLGAEVEHQGEKVQSPIAALMSFSVLFPVVVRTLFDLGKPFHLLPIMYPCNTRNLLKSARLV
jgi:hypothetical protein